MKGVDVILCLNYHSNYVALLVYRCSCHFVYLNRLKSQCLRHRGSVRSPLLIHSCSLTTVHSPLFTHLCSFTPSESCSFTSAHSPLFTHLCSFTHVHSPLFTHLCLSHVLSIGWCWASSRRPHEPVTLHWHAIKTEDSISQHCRPRTK